MTAKADGACGLRRNRRLARQRCLSTLVRPVDSATPRRRGRCEIVGQGPEDIAERVLVGEDLIAGQTVQISVRDVSVRVGLLRPPGPGAVVVVLVGVARILDEAVADLGDGPVARVVAVAIVCVGAEALEIPHEGRLVHTQETPPVQHGSRVIQDTHRDTLLMEVDAGVLHRWRLSSVETGLNDKNDVYHAFKNTTTAGPASS